RLDPLSIDENIQLVTLHHTEDVRRVFAALQTNLDDVFGVERKVMADRDSPTRPDRQIVAFAFGLNRICSNLVLSGCRAQFRITDGEPGDLCGGRKVLFEEAGGN